MDIKRIREEALVSYFEKIRNIPLLTNKEELKLCLKGDKESRLKLVLANLRFVVWVAKKYRRSNVSLLELIQAGNLGLIKASHKFDYKKGEKFLPYAIWWIKQVIMSTINGDNTIVVHNRGKQEWQKYKKTLAILIKKQKYSPTAHEVAKAMGKEVEYIKKMELIKQSYQILSLDNNFVFGDGSSITWIDVIEDKRAKNPEKNAIVKNTIAKVFSGSILNQREKQVLSIRFGIDGKGKRSFADTGKEIGVSRTTIQNIETHALKKLRWAYNK